MDVPEVDFSEFINSEDDLTSPVVIKSTAHLGNNKRKRIIDSEDEASEEGGVVTDVKVEKQSSTTMMLDDDGGWLEKREVGDARKGLIPKRRHPPQRRDDRFGRATSVDSLVNLSTQSPPVLKGNSMSSPDLFIIEDTPEKTEKVVMKAPNVSVIKSSTMSRDREMRHDRRADGRKPVTKQQVKKKDSSSDDSESGDGYSGGSSDDDSIDANEWDDDVTAMSKIKERVKHILDNCGKLSAQLQKTMKKWGLNSTSDSNCVNLAEISGGGEGEDDTMALLRPADFEDICPGLVLKDYQTVGVNWMRLLHENRVNGVLADDMGLGKTIQTIAFLSWLKEQEEQNDRHVTHLVIVPASTLDNWINEFAKFSPGMVVVPYRGSQTERFHLARDLLIEVDNDEVDVIISTYTMFERESGKEDRKFLRRISFSYLVLDEAHCIKNASSSRFEYLRMVHSSRRLLLSGTPVQNDVKELLTLLSFLTPKVFRGKDVETLLSGLTVDEKNGYRGTSSELVPIRHIRTMMAPFVMRRLKVDVLGQLPAKQVVAKLLQMETIQAKVYSNIIRAQINRREMGNNGKDGVDIDAILVAAGMEVGANTTAAEKKKLLVKAKKKIKAEKELQELLSCTGPRASSNKPAAVGDANAFEVVNLADEIECETSRMLDGDIDNMLGKMKTSDINNLFTALRKAANHPLLLRVHYTEDETIDMVARVALANGHFGDQAGYDRVRAEICTFSDFDIHHLCLEYPSTLGHLQLKSEVLYDSVKMTVLKELLPSLVADGHRILIFSQWTRILDLLEVLMNQLEYSFLRLDGSTPVSTRQDMINKFNLNESIPVFLLSTKAGGLGINLTAADTVILHDLDVNPENDRQAEDRAHRIGQTRLVTVYKLVVEGTVDEGIYDIGKRKTELINSVLARDKPTDKKAGAAEDKAVIATLLQKAMSSMLAKK